MDWIKKNWITIAVVVVLIIAVIIYFLKKKKTSLLTGKSGKTALQSQYDACMEGTRNIRLAAGATSPCAKLKSALDKESSYSGDNQVNVVDYAIGAQGMSMLTEKHEGIQLPNINIRNAESNYTITGCPPGLLPNDTTGNCDNSEDWDQVPESSYNALSTTNGLNIVDFASGLEGTSLLLDKNMKSK